ncbi:MAG: TlpA family protein disulfide reductase [Thermoguttaceae bacterium]|nr:TlpA family protein disulfide reductase [Thermoguttaceae bacterium]
MSHSELPSPAPQASPSAPDQQPPAPRLGSLILGLAIIAIVLVSVGALAIQAFLVPERRWEELAENRAARHSAVGRRLPALELEPLVGAERRVTLVDLAGQVALVNFWGTWCPPCREELPELAGLCARLAGHSRFRFLAVSCLARGNEEAHLDDLREDTAAFLAARKLTLATYADPRGVTRAAVKQLGAWSVYPTTILLDGQGVVRALWTGYGPGVVEDMEKRILELLAEHGPAT